MVNVITDVLSSPESALLLSVLYDNKMDLNKENHPLGPVLFKDEEDIITCTRMDNLTKIYHTYDISKFFNISIIEFFDLPSWQINILIENAEEFIKKLNNDLEDIEGDVGNIGKDVKTMNDALGAIND